LFVDYAGQTLDVADGSTGELRTAQVFVAVLGAVSPSTGVRGDGRMADAPDDYRSPGSAW
jgi:hypothetical protein